MTNSKIVGSLKRRVDLPISIVLLMAIIACQSKTDNQIVAKRIEFSYSYLDTLYSSHWLKLDGLNFRHSDKEADWNPQTMIQMSGIDTISHLLPKAIDTVIYLPASKSFYDTPQGVVDRFFENPSHIDIATNLARKLVKYNREAERPVYKITGGPMLITQGTFMIERFDGEDIKLLKSDNYPSRITPVK